MGNIKSKQSRYRALSPSSETDCSSLSFTANPAVGKRLSRLQSSFAQEPTKPSSLINFPQSAPSTRGKSSKNPASDCGLTGFGNLCPSKSSPSSVIANIGVDSRHPTNPFLFDEMLVKSTSPDRSHQHSNRHHKELSGTSGPSPVGPGSKGHRRREGNSKLSSRLPTASEKHSWVWKLQASDSDGQRAVSEPEIKGVSRLIKDAILQQTQQPLSENDFGYKIEVKITKIKTDNGVDESARKMSPAQNPSIPAGNPSVRYSPPKKRLLNSMPDRPSTGNRHRQLRREKRELIRLVEENHARNNIPIINKREAMLDYLPVQHDGKNRQVRRSVAENADLIIRHDHVHHFPKGYGKVTLI